MSFFLGREFKSCGESTHGMWPQWPFLEGSHILQYPLKCVIMCHYFQVQTLSDLKSKQQTVYIVTDMSVQKAGYMWHTQLCLRVNNWITTTFPKQKRR